MLYVIGIFGWIKSNSGKLSEIIELNKLCNLNVPTKIDYDYDYICAGRSIEKCIRDNVNTSKILDILRTIAFLYHY